MKNISICSLITFLAVCSYAQNVGIGTTNPTSKLHVVSNFIGPDPIARFENTTSPSGTSLLITSSNNSSIWSTFNGAGFIGTSLATSFSLRTNSADRLLIDANGNVGINTVTPGSKLSVVGTGTNIADFNSSQPTSRIVLRNGSNFSFWGATNAYSFIGSGTTNAFSVQTDGLDRIFVLGNGNIGIGTTSPTSLLHVNGTTMFEGNSNLTGNLAVTGNQTISGTLGFGNLLNQNLSANGYAKIGSLIIQWGSGNYSSNSDVTVTFPITFTNVFSVTATVDAGNNTGAGANVPCKVSAITNTDFKYAGTQVFSGDAVSKVRWVAIGN
jgi:hypothetical protein